MSIDPITIEVVTSRIREIASTMEHALYHSGYSPVLRESKDGTAGLTDADGRVVIEVKVAEQINQAHEMQLLNYLRATGLRAGLVLNFGPRPTFRRQLL